MIKVFLVDDHVLFRESLRSLLVNEEIAEVVGEASNGKEFLESLEECIRPDIILMDIDMPEMNGVEATSKAIALDNSYQILALSMFGDEQYYYEMISAGARGFVMKSSGAEELTNAIKTVARGGEYFSNELLRKIIVNIGVDKFNKNIHIRLKLSKREEEVLNAICKGLSNDEIAKQLFISPRTVKGHKSKILSKTGCKNTASLILYAINNKLVKVG